MSEPELPTGPASREQLLELWQFLLYSLVTALKGNTPPRASLLGVARQFLRDNGVSAEVANAMAAKSALQDLKDRAGDDPLESFVMPFPAPEQ